MARRSFVAAWLATFVVALSLAGPSAIAAVNQLSDGITGGVVRTNDVFGRATVIVPQNGYITYFARGAANLAGTVVEVWMNTGGDWTKATTRAFADDGTLHYFARINARTSFRAIVPGTPGGSAHGRSAAAWSSAAEQRTQIRVGCADFTTDDFGRVSGSSSPLVQRTVALLAGSRIDVVLCSNDFFGYQWNGAAIDSAHLRLIGHRYVNTSDFLGAPGTETWSFRITGRGTGHAVLAYGKSSAAGQRAAWLFVLTTLS